VEGGGWGLGGDGEITVFLLSAPLNEKYKYNLHSFYFTMVFSALI
jgi:hypothetical protein